MFRPPSRKLVFVQPAMADIPSAAESPFIASAYQLAAAGAIVEFWTTTESAAERPAQVTVEAAKQPLENRVLMRRFACQPLNEPHYHQLRYRLTRGESLSDDEEIEFLRNDLRSEALRQAIHQSRHESIYLFNPCVSAITVHGVSAAPNESVLVPDLGQPLLGQLRIVRQTVDLCQNLLFHSEPERLIGEAIFDLSHKHCVAASGIDGAEESANAFDSLAAPLPQPYLIAHVASEQALERLCEMTARLASDTPLPWRLILLAPPPGTIPARYRNIVKHSGTPVERRALLANATCYLHVSEDEKISPLMLQAWLHECPALVYSGSTIATAHVRLAQAGLCFDTYEEFRHAAMGLAREPKLGRDLGENGRRYVRRYFRWNTALEKQMRFLRHIEQRLKEVAA